jgi:hypothetical protein
MYKAFVVAAAYAFALACVTALLLKSARRRG